MTWADTATRNLSENEGAMRSIKALHCRCHPPYWHQRKRRRPSRMRIARTLPALRRSIALDESGSSAACRCDFGSLYIITDWHTATFITVDARRR